MSKSIYPNIQTAITENGIKNIDDINIGDKVYNYLNNELIEVKDIVEEFDIINEIKYNDNRILYIGENERIPKDFPIKSIQYINVQKPLLVDPTTAGALFIYGDQDDDELNFPLDLIDNIRVLFGANNKVKYAEKLGKNKVYFSYIDDIKPIKWREFFKYKFYATTKHFSDGIIPDEYLYSSLKDRTKFIMGIFDAGYNRYRFRHKVGICHHDEFKLRVVQRILWSLGILSDVKYIPGYKDENDIYRYYPHKRFFELSILDPRRYPGLFYIRENIENIILFNDWVNNLRKEWYLQIINKKPLQRALIKNLVFDKQIYYYTGNFLPRSSK